MRKSVVFLCLSIFTLTSLCGCGANPMREESVELSAEEELEQLNESVTYLDTFRPSDMWYDADMEAYHLEDDGTAVYYYFDQDGNCVGAFAFETLYDTPLSEEEITERLEAYLEPVLAEGEYEMEPIEYTPDIEDYTLCGYHKINGIKTRDFVFCTMDACGNVTAVQFPHQNEFADVDLGEINAENVNATFESQIADEIGQDDFAILDVMLCKDDVGALAGALYLEFTVEYEEEEAITTQEPVDIYLTGPEMAGDNAEAQTVVSKGLDLSVDGGEAVAYTDDHGGFLGDGTTFIALQFSNDAVLEEIRASEEWSAFPLDDTVATLIYGVTDVDENGEEYRDGMTAHVIYSDSTPMFPEIEHGYYRLIDRFNPQSDDAKYDILDRYSYNFTLGIYDTDTDILYYCEYDT